MLIGFAFMAILVLGTDLWVKRVAFLYVAGEPVKLSLHHANSPEQIPPHHPMPLISGVLSLRLTLNQGAVFGIGQGGRWFFIAVSILASGFILWLLWRAPAKAYLVHLCYALIWAGAMGNLYDRLLYNAVRDMFWLFPGVHLPFGLHWPGGSRHLYPWLFNVADAALVVGVCLIVILMQLADRRVRKHAKTPH